MGAARQPRVSRGNSHSPVHSDHLPSGGVNVVDVFECVNEKGNGGEAEPSKEADQPHSQPGEQTRAVVQHCRELGSGRWEDKSIQR